VFGQAHAQAGILVEPKAEYAIDVADQDQLIKFRNLIWLVLDICKLVNCLNVSFCRPTIDEANKVAPSFSRIFKELILVTHKDKPLPRAGKGTVMRKAALKEYHDEIEALSAPFLFAVQHSTNRYVIRYESVEGTQTTESIPPPAVWDTLHVTQWLLAQASELNSDNVLLPSKDIFEQGFDR
jgi:hypothetical protein